MSLLPGALDPLAGEDVASPICSGTSGAMFTNSSSAARTTVASGAPSSWRRSLTRKVSEDSSGWSTNRTRRSEAVAPLQAGNSRANADVPLSSPSRKTRRTAATTSVLSGRLAIVPHPLVLEGPRLGGGRCSG